MNQERIVGVGVALLIFGLIAYLFVHQDALGPLPPLAAPSASASASVSKPSPSVPSAAATAPPQVVWETVTDPTELLGRWVDAEKGDALPKGPTGGSIVDGGVRFEVEQRDGSKTPFNLKFWAPRAGHRTSATISGGCGFYPPEGDGNSMTTFCRGYGLQGDDALETMMTVEQSGAVMRVAIGSFLAVDLRKAD